MRFSRSIAACFLVVLCGGCEEERHVPAPASKPAPRQTNEAPPVAAPSTTKPRPQLRAFLDQKKEVPAGLEWNREVTSRNGGTISFRVDSQGPFAVTVVTGKAYNALKAGDNKPLNQSDVLLTVDSQGPTHEGTVTIPAGTSYFVIANQAKKTVEFRLQCFAGS
jgi:hypothetical protein